MASKNRLYTRSYFVKRLIDEKITCRSLIDNFVETDVRRWSVLIYPNQYNILCTCYKRSADDYWFKFDTEKKSNMQVKTQSMNVIIQFIQDYVNENKKINEENTQEINISADLTEISSSPP